ncbi:unnamed protein product [Soboliphyme baturini]|uniref:Large ribosomal subunit protein uL23m n=1 Tax=Soboliphyme baturini TaxID=241478 RepID=A0A183IHE0_9BILA|nr:unnamed protein product [Soboliphyme baturini]
MKLVRPGAFEHMPPYILKFIISPQMTRIDVRDYLVKIYDLPVRQVRILNKMGNRRYNCGVCSCFIRSYAILHHDLYLQQ